MACGATDHGVPVLAPARHRERVGRTRPAIHQETGVAGKRSAPVAGKVRRILQQIIRPGSCGVEHQLGANVEVVAVHAVARAYAAHAPAIPQKAQCLGVIRGNRPAVRGRFDEGKDQARRVVHLAVFEDRPARQRALLEFRKQVERLVPGQQLGTRNAALRIGNSGVLPHGQEIVGKHAGRQECLALPAMAIGGYDDGQWIHQVGGDAQHRRALGAGCAQPAYIGVLQVADAAMHHLKALGRRAGCKVALIDHRDLQSPQCGVPGGRSAESPAADDQHIELSCGQRGEITIHRNRHGLQARWRTNDRQGATRSRQS